MKTRKFSNCLFIPILMMMLLAGCVSNTDLEKKEEYVNESIVKVDFEQFKSYINQHIAKAPTKMQLADLKKELPNKSADWKSYQLHENLIMMIKQKGNQVIQVALVSASKDNSIDQQMVYVQEALVSLFSPDVNPPSSILMPVVAKIQQAKSSVSFNYKQGAVIYQMAGQGKVTSFVVRPIND